MTDKFETRHIPKRLPGDRLEYWHACKVEYFANGVCQPKFTRSINNQDLRQLAREAAKYVFAQYVWTRIILPKVDKLYLLDLQINFNNFAGGINLVIKYLVPTKANSNVSVSNNLVFINEFIEYWEFTTRR